MEQQPVKVAVVFGVLVIAIIAALTFKRGEKPAPASATPSSPITVNKPVVESAFDERLSRLTGDIQQAPTPKPSEVVTPVDLNAPPPALPSKFSREPVNTVAKPAPFLFEDEAAGDDVGPRTHRVHDGDTLASLAERYLGDASRADELLAANRELISNPELLPIDVELVIPAPKAISAEELDEEHLVPVAPSHH